MTAPEMENGDKQIYREQAGLELNVEHEGGKDQRQVDIGVHSKFEARGVYLGIAEAVK